MSSADLEICASNFVERALIAARSLCSRRSKRDGSEGGSPEGIGAAVLYRFLTHEEKNFSDLKKK